MIKSILETNKRSKVHQDGNISPSTQQQQNQQQPDQQQQQQQPQQPQAGPSSTQSSDENSEDSITRSQSPDNPGPRNMPFSNKTVLYSNDLFDIYVERVEFKRQKMFRIEDFLFLMKVDIKKNGTSMPTLKSSIEIIEKAVVEVINNIKPLYDPQETCLLYMTITQTGMIAPIRSEGIDIQRSATPSIVRHVMNIFYRYCNSNDTLRLNDGFRIYFKTFCHAHVHSKQSRRKTFLRTTLGSKENVTHEIQVSGCLYFDELVEKEFATFCLLISCIVLDSFNRLKSTKSTDFFTYKELWTRKKKSETSCENAIFKLKRALKKLITALSLSLVGPYPLETIEKLSNYFQSQIHVIKNTQEIRSSIMSWPNVFDGSKPQIFLLQTSPSHVIPIFNLKLFFNKNRQICMLCKETVKSFYSHVCLIKTLQCSCCLFPFATSEDMFVQTNLPFKYCYRQLQKTNESFYW